MLSVTPVMFSILFAGLFLINGVQGLANIELDIDIQLPANYTAPPCDAEKQAAFELIFQRVVDKKFKKYYQELAALYEVASPGDVCELPTTDRRDLEVLADGRHRSLNRFRPIRFGYTYQSSFQCAFCNPETVDPIDGAPGLPPPPPGEAVSEEDIAKLQARLQRKLTRKLTQKVNNHKKSCWEGSDSVVVVTVAQQDLKVGTLPSACI